MIRGLDREWCGRANLDPVIKHQGSIVKITLVDFIPNILPDPSSSLQPMRSCNSFGQDILLFLFLCVNVDM